MCCHRSSGPAALDAAPKLVTTRGGTQVETLYDWTPTVRSFDGPVSLVFDGLPADGQSIMQGPIRLHSSLKLRPSVDPESVVVATVGNFTIGFAGLVSVAVRELQLTQRSGHKPEVSFALAGGADNPLRLLDKIDFLQPLLDVAHTLLGAAPAVDLAGGVVKIGYAAALPALSIGVFSLENIRIGVGLAIPLGGDPVAFDFNFGEKDHHFLVTVAFIGGGGFFAIEVDADGPRSIELAVEVAASVALDLGVASGSAHVAVGVYLHFVPGGTVITGFVRAGGELTVLAVLSLHVELYLGLTYESNAGAQGDLRRGEPDGRGLDRLSVQERDAVDAARVRRRRQRDRGLAAGARGAVDPGARGRARLRQQPRRLAGLLRSLRLNGRCVFETQREATMPDTRRHHPPAVDRAARRCAPRCERARDAAPVGAPRTSHRGRGDAGAMPAVLGQRRQRRLAGQGAPVPLRTARLGRRGAALVRHPCRRSHQRGDGRPDAARRGRVARADARHARDRAARRRRCRSRSAATACARHAMRSWRRTVRARTARPARNSRSSRPGQGCSPAAAWRRQRQRPASAEQLAMDRMSTFYDTLAKGAQARYAAAAEKGFVQTPPAFDFHAAVAVASRYPALMRALGLLFDFELQLDALALPAIGWLHVHLATPSPAADAIEPMLTTRFAFGPGERFVTIPRADFAADTDLDDRMLLLGDSDYCSVDVNLSELHHGVRNAAARFQAERARGASIAAALQLAPLPTPRSDGLALARDDHGTRLAALIAAQHELDVSIASADEANPLRLGAEQVLLGFRVDIRTVGETTWRSLCARQGRYTFTSAGFTRDWPADEGCLGFHAFDPAPAGSPQSGPWAHETWFRWQGWSLAAPRPGRHIGIDGASASNADTPAGNLAVDVRFDVPPGSLPRLRFGRAYDCRLRAVDLAGSSLAVDDPISESYALPLGPYLRFDPLPAPVLLAPAPAGPGESIERLVIHGDGVIASRETAERLVAPPKTTQALAEWHGVLDAPSGIALDAFAQLQGHDGNWPEDPDPGLLGSVPPPLPYLPDPLAQQACLDFHPDQLLVQNPPLPMLLPFDGDWPARRPLRLRLIEGRGDPQWDAAARLLTVPVPPGQTRNLTVASLPADDTGFALFDWWQALINDPARVHRVASDQATARRGRIRGLTPWRRVTLVNAVQRPLVRPDFSANPMAPRRTHGNTACLFVGVTAVDVPSTLKLELMASWDEALDNGVDAPSRQSYATLAYRRDVATDEKDPTFIDRPWSWNLGDDHPGGNYLLPFHEFRDTRHRRVSYRTVATSRYAEYFGPGDPGDAGRFTQVSEASTLEIPASARPAAPKVLRVVPSFRWDEQVDAQGVRTRTRRAGVRVVMDRPWYSSGDGEQLGVMLLAADPNPPPPPPPPDPGPEPGPGPFPGAVLSGPIAPAVAPLVTQWGNDPTVGVGPDLPAPRMPTPAQFSERGGGGLRHHARRRQPGRAVRGGRLRRPVRATRCRGPRCVGRCNAPCQRRPLVRRHRHRSRCGKPAVHPLRAGALPGECGGRFGRRPARVERGPRRLPAARART